LFRHTPGEWQIVVTAIPETMRRRSGGNLAFGLASSDEEQRRACVEFHRHLLNKINAVNQRFANKVISLELQAAPLGGNADVAQATDAFARSIKEIASWDWSCSLVLEHCDAMNKPAPRKGFCRWKTCWIPSPVTTLMYALTGRVPRLKGVIPPCRWNILRR
jgi:hypothetical protein